MKDLVRWDQKQYTLSQLMSLWAKHYYFICNNDLNINNASIVIAF